MKNSLKWAHDQGSIGSFDFTKVTRETYASLMSSFVKPNGRMIVSIADYECSEHPTLPFAVTEEEIVKLYKEYFQAPELLQEYNANDFYTLNIIIYTRWYLLYNTIKTTQFKFSSLKLKRSPQ